MKESLNVPSDPRLLRALEARQAREAREAKEKIEKEATDILKELEREARVKQQEIFAAEHRERLRQKQFEQESLLSTITNGDNNETMADGENEGFKKRRRAPRPVRGERDRGNGKLGAAASFVVRLEALPKLRYIMECLSMLEANHIPVIYPRCLPTGHIILMFETQQYQERAAALLSQLYASSGEVTVSAPAHGGEPDADEPYGLEAKDIGKLYDEYYDASHPRSTRGLQVDHPPQDTHVLHIIQAMVKGGLALQEPYTLDTGSIRLFLERETDIPKAKEVLAGLFRSHEAVVVRLLSDVLVEASKQEAEEEVDEEEDETDPLAIVLEGRKKKKTIQEVLKCLEKRRITLQEPPRILEKPEGLRLLARSTYDKATALVALSELFKDDTKVKVFSPIVGPGRLLTRKLAALSQAVQLHGVRSYNRMYILSCRLHLNSSISHISGLVTRVASDYPANVRIPTEEPKDGQLVILPHYKTFCDICKLALGIRGRDRFQGQNRVKVDKWIEHIEALLMEIPKLWALADERFVNEKQKVRTEERIRQEKLEQIRLEKLAQDAEREKEKREREDQEKERQEREFVLEEELEKERRERARKRELEEQRRKEQERKEEEERYELERRRKWEEDEENRRRDDERRRWEQQEYEWRVRWEEEERLRDYETRMRERDHRGQYQGYEVPERLKEYDIREPYRYEQQYSEQFSARDAQRSPLPSAPSYTGQRAHQPFPASNFDERQDYHQPFPRPDAINKAERYQHANSFHGRSSPLPNPYSSRAISPHPSSATTQSCWSQHHPIHPAPPSYPSSSYPPMRPRLAEYGHSFTQHQNAPAASQYPPVQYPGNYGQVPRQGGGPPY